MSAVGASPNANAATLTGQVLNLQPFNTSFPGVVSASGGGTTNFLRADGSWTTPPGTATGTVTSVGLSVPAASILSVSGSPVTTSGTLALATTGTSGGIPYFSSTSVLSSSALLAANQVVIGGGAGVAPSTLAASTNGFVLTLVAGAPAWATPATSGTVTSVALTAPAAVFSVSGSPVTTSGTLALAITAAQAISSTSIDWSTGSLFTKTLGANTTFTFTGNVSGQTIVVRLTNTASNWTVTWPSVRWASGTPPVMTIGAVSDVYTFIYDGANFYGSAVQNLS